MTVKLLGTMIVIFGCGGCGFMMAVSQKRESAALRQLSAALEFMQNELRYRLTPLPDLCKSTAAVVKGQIGCFFEILSQELEHQISPNARICVDAALSKCRTIPQQTYEILTELGKTFGVFDLEGQLESLSCIRDLTEMRIKKYTDNQDIRIRSYQTLGLCAGAALAILFI